MGKICLIVSCLLIFAVTAFGEDTVKDEVFEAVPDENGVQKVAITADSYFFQPKHIIVKAGSPVEIAIKKASGIVPHSFVLDIPESNIHIKQNLGTELSKIRFTPTVPGKYAFYCDKQLLFFASHREKGMEGVLEVK